jgi:hypothetical protein
MIFMMMVMISDNKKKKKKLFSLCGFRIIKERIMIGNIVRSSNDTAFGAGFSPCTGVVRRKNVIAL